MALRIAAAAGLMGDQLPAARRLVDAMQVDCVTLHYLNPASLATLAMQRQADPQAGFVSDLPLAITSLLKPLAKQPFTVISNAGGLNPQGCAAAVSQLLIDAGLGEITVGVVSGDDLTTQLPELMQSGHPFLDSSSNQPLSETTAPMLHASACLGASAVQEALAAGARIVITGNVASTSLTTAPCMHHYGWTSSDLQQLAGASVAGHLLQHGAQVTGGYSTRWSRYNLSNIGYPVAVVAADGSCIITRPPRSGGVVNRHTVIEQLLYGVEDPQQCATPDVAVDFSPLQVEELPSHGATRAGVQLSGAGGSIPAGDYNVSVAYRDGYTAAGQVLVYGRDCIEKAEAVAAMLFDRLRRDGCELKESCVEFPGAGQLIHPASAPPEDLRELLLRIAVRDPDRGKVARFVSELTPLVNSGPAGIANGAAPQIRTAITHRNTLIARSHIQPQTEVRAAKDWTSGP